MESCRTKLVIILQTQISCIRRYVRNITNKLLVIIRSLRVGFASFQNLAPETIFAARHISHPSMRNFTFVKYY